MVDADRAIPKRITESIDRYVKTGALPGGFLRAVISNDLKNAIGSADDENKAVLDLIVMYMTWETPSKCWGSIVKMDNWAYLGGLEGGAQLS